MTALSPARVLLAATFQPGRGPTQIHIVDPAAEGGEPGEVVAVLTLTSDYTRPAELRFAEALARAFTEARLTLQRGKA